MVAPTIDNTFGAAFAGTNASVFLFGILCTQCYVFYERYPKDRRLYKRMVVILWLLEAAHTFCTVDFFYHYEIKDWGKAALITSERVVWSLAAQFILSAVVSTIVKLYFAWRVWRLSNMNVWITAPIALSPFAQLGFSIWFAVAGLRLPSLAHFGDIFGVATAALGLGVLTDAVTAAVVTWYLSKFKTGYKSSDMLVKKLIRYAINTGLLTSGFSIACLITYGIMPNNFIFISLYFILSKLYANSLLVDLNARPVVEGRGTDDAHETIPTFVMQVPGSIPEGASRAVGKWEGSSRESGSTIQRISAFIFR